MLSTAYHPESDPQRELTRIQREATNIFLKRFRLTMPMDAMGILLEWWEQHADDIYGSDENPLQLLQLIAQKCATKMSQESQRSQVLSIGVLQDVLSTVFASIRLSTAQGVDLQDASKHFHVIDAFSVPRRDYISNLKSFVAVQEPPKLLGSADAKASVHRARYDLIRQRILRNPNFALDSVFQDPTQRKRQTDVHHITGIKHVKTKEDGHYVCLGMLTKMPSGFIHLEDPDADIRLEFSPELGRSVGMYTENCFVIVYGELQVGVLQDGKWDGVQLFVKNIFHPPPEERSLTDSHVTLDFFGAPVETVDFKKIEASLAKELEDISFFVFSDVWLDQPKTLDRLRKVFDRLTEDIIPFCIVLMGNFSSTPVLLNGTDTQQFQNNMNGLVDLICEYPHIQRGCHWILIPGPNDPGWSNGLIPRDALGHWCTARLIQRLGSRLTLGTNPCRVKFLSREIVFFRDDLTTRMERNSILAWDKEREPAVSGHITRTIFDQSHLSPLPIDVRPVYWEHDQALRLYPMPHAVILGDKVDAFEHVYEGSAALNPGSFASSGTFLDYRPFAIRTEDGEAYNGNWNLCNV